MKIGIQTWGSGGESVRSWRSAPRLRNAATPSSCSTPNGRAGYDGSPHGSASARGVGSPVTADPAARIENRTEGRSTATSCSKLGSSAGVARADHRACLEAGLGWRAGRIFFIHHFILHPARAAADKAGTPQITVTFAHMLTPSRFFHPPETPWLGEWGNVLEWKIASFALNKRCSRTPIDSGPASA